ncbi:hypothetical protein ACJW30_06G035300 [Castanea mollissima]
MGFLSKSNLLFVLCCLCLNFGVAVDTIRSSQSIKDTNSDCIISNGSAFKLGFFSPVNSTNRYLGIWYNRISVFTVVWVANRVKPFKDYSGVLTIFEDGNLVVLNGQKEILWSSNVTNSVVNPSAQLLDSGNLVLRDNTARTNIWESFQFPTNTMLPKMKIGANARTGKKVQLTSWKSPSDPSIGSFSLGFDPLSIGIPQSFIWKERSPYWHSGPWNGRIFIGVPIWILHFVMDLVVVLKALQSECNFYGKCRAFGSWGFEPRNTEEWKGGNWSSGCVRRTPLQCERVSTTGGEGSKMDGFLKLNMMKVPDFADYSSALEGESHAYDNGTTCFSWTRSLIDAQKFSSELAQSAKKNGLTQKKRMLAILGVSVAVMFLLVVSVVYWFVMNKKKGERHSTYSYSVDSTLPYFEGCPSRSELDETRRNSNLPLFDLRTIIAATDNFSISNKLGQGGFGPVYKGLLQNGMEIAVKRLSKCSGQGIEQFKTEVALIAELQHRNLVRILDETKRPCLDWGKRFEIICGIARGILYLHQDSRLRIIHRDLKASNVLLDKALNPKISDFGMARIVGGDQIEVNTNCIVGTFGYMSPEYAMQDLFSIKSDVYSFKVLLLEIITSKKNSTYDHDGPSSNLIGHVKDIAMKMVDPSLEETYSVDEVSRCIQIGLLCVQEHATDWPTIFTVVFMLGNDTPLPSPKHPAFILKGTYNSTNRSTSEASNFVNDITISKIDGR